MRLTGDPRRLDQVALTESGLTPAGAIAAVAVCLALTFVLDLRTDAAPVQHLDHLPIILAAFRLRWMGGLVASLAAVVLYHLANPALLSFEYHESDFVQIALFIAVGVVTARLTENARRLRVIAMTDDLTGLHNLRSFEVGLSDMIRAARTGGGTIWMLVLDLDKLKSLNDTYGHLTGAEAVRHVGHVLRLTLPSNALACRYGGDEFAVCIYGPDERDIRSMAATLCDGVHSSAPTLAGRPFPAGTLSISVWVARHDWPAGAAADGDDRVGEALFRAADAALYRAKTRGRNQVFVAVDPPPVSTSAVVH